jgi:predicted small metal-binding protein
MIITLTIGKGAVNMDKTINCKDLGSECGFTAWARTEIEFFQKVLKQGEAAHGMKEFSQEFYDKVRSSIQEGYCDLEDESELYKYSECCC